MPAEAALLNDQNMKTLLNALAADEDACKTHKTATGPGSVADATAPPKTFSEAAKRALLAGFSMSQIITAFIGGYITGGLAGGIAAVMALIFTPPNPAPSAI